MLVATAISYVMEVSDKWSDQVSNPALRYFCYFSAARDVLVRESVKIAGLSQMVCKCVRVM